MYLYTYILSFSDYAVVEEGECKVTVSEYVYNYLFLNISNYVKSYLLNWLWKLPLYIDSVAWRELKSTWSINEDNHVVNNVSYSLKQNGWTHWIVSWKFLHMTVDGTRNLYDTTVISALKKVFET